MVNKKAKKKSKPRCSKKPMMSKKKAESILNDASDDKAFFMNDGRTLKNLHELGNDVHNWHDDLFGHHVNEEKNDLANWVGDVFGDKELAADLKKTKCKHKTAKKVKARVRKLQSYIG